MKTSLEGLARLSVDKSKSRNPDEEFAYLVESKEKFGNFFMCDNVHPNKVRTHRMAIDRVNKKLDALVDTEE